jgi:hypothetical protein
MIDRTTIRSAAVAALISANTSAGASVFSPKDWAAPSGKFPQIVVRTPRERKENVAPRSGSPQFFSTITLTATGMVEATTEAAAETALETLSDQIENALLTNAQFAYVNGIQQFSSVETTMSVVAESERHYGETVVTFEVEVFQIYEPVIDAAGTSIGPSLTSIGIVISEPSGTVEPGATITVPGG